MPYITSELQAVIDFISNTPKPATIHDFKIWSEHPISFTMIMIVGTLVLVIVVVSIYMIGKKKRGGIENQIVVAMPMKELGLRDIVKEVAVEKY